MLSLILGASWRPLYPLILACKSNCIKNVISVFRQGLKIAPQRNRCEQFTRKFYYSERTIALDNAYSLNLGSQAKELMGPSSYESFYCFSKNQRGSDSLACVARWACRPTSAQLPADVSQSVFLLNGKLSGDFSLKPQTDSFLWQLSSLSAFTFALHPLMSN